MTAVLHAAKITRFQASVMRGRLRVGGTDAREVPARGIPNTRSGLSPPRLRLLSEGLHRRSAWAPEARRNSGAEPGFARLPAPLVARRQPPGLMRHGGTPRVGVPAPAHVALGRDQYVLAERREVAVAERAAVGGRLDSGRP